MKNSMLKSVLRVFGSILVIDKKPDDFGLEVFGPASVIEFGPGVILYMPEVVVAVGDIFKRAALVGNDVLHIIVQELLLMDKTSVDSLVSSSTKVSSSLLLLRKDLSFGVSLISKNE